MDDFLLACEADARSRNPELSAYAPADRLRTLLAAARDVNVDTRGKNGQEIGVAIRQARIEAIQKSL